MGKNYKDYGEWMGVKARVNNHGLVRTFKEGEIWWAAVGEKAKAMDVTRLYEKISELSRGDYRRIRDAFFKIM